MNYVLPFQNNREVKCLIQQRGRLVAEAVLQQVRFSQQQTLGQSGFLSWTSVRGKTWGVFESGRCLWLLHVEEETQRVLYYRNRGDLEHLELHEQGHAGNDVCQKVELIGTLIHSYECKNGLQRQPLERKLHWWRAQRWFREFKSQVFRFKKAA